MNAASSSSTSRAKAAISSRWRAFIVSSIRPRPPGSHLSDLSVIAVSAPMKPPANAILFASRQIFTRPSARWRIAEARISAPFTTSPKRVNSSGVCESPFTEGMNTMPIGQISAMRQAS